MASLGRTGPLDRPSVSPRDPQCRSERMARGDRLLPIVANLRANRPPCLAGCRTAWVLQQVDEPALGARVTLDVTLRVFDRPVAGQLLNIAQATARLEHQPRGIGDEGTAPRVR